MAHVCERYSSGVVLCYRCRGKGICLDAPTKIWNLCGSCSTTGQLVCPNCDDTCIIR